MINRALLDVTAPKLAQEVPSVEYCQIPLPVLAVIAKPLDGLVSTSLQLVEVRIELANIPGEGVSSFVVVIEADAPLVIVGASLILVTMIEAVATLVE